MKYFIFTIAGSMVILAIGLCVGLILYPVIYLEDDPEIIDSEVIANLINEQNILYILIDQQDEIINIYEKMINSYNEALSALTETGDYQ